MSVASPLAEGWQQVEHPSSLFRRYQFASYRDTRAFLDKLAALSAETGLYPDLGFGTTYVNVTVPSKGAAEQDAAVDFANRVRAFAPAAAPSA